MVVGPLLNFVVIILRRTGGFSEILKLECWVV